ncbi:MAG TPA: acylphosphatase [Nocardioidaceae bacterium]|nr:acylphosphatase [Nocardioidaceae bacterium]
MRAATVAKDVIVRGRVQGVFFRDSTRRRAEAAGLSGWVRNEPDGTVRARLEGGEQAVAAVVEWMRSGPSQAHVAELDVTDVPATGLTGFEVV